MSFFFPVENTRLHAGLVHVLVRFVVLPQPADNLVAGVKRGLLAFETGVLGRYFFEEKVLG